MKVVIYEEACKRAPAKTPEVDKELRTQAIGRAGKAKGVASGFTNTGEFRGSIHVSKHEKGYSVDIDDPNALSIVFGHEYEGWARGRPRFEGHDEVIKAILA